MPIVQHPNAVSFSDLEAEFGGVSGPPAPPATRMPIPMNNYYSGAGYVAANTPGFPLGGSAVTIPSSGQISMGNFHGSAGQFTATIGSNQQQLNLRSWALANGWNGSSTAVITVGSGVYIWSDNTAVAAMTINGSWPGGINLINNGFIIGKGGTGEGWDSPTATTRTPGTAGGPAILLGVNCIITNNGYIAGGGGGGGAAYIGGPGGGSGFGGGGGAGGGRGGNTGHNSLRGTFQLAGGSGGGLGAAGGGGASQPQISAGGGGGRILPGTGGTSAFTISAAGGGGAGGGGGIGPGILQNGAPNAFGGGGGGGGWGASGGPARVTATTGGEGGSANNVGGTPQGSGTSFGAGYAGGNAINLNGFSVTWNAFGTRYGAIA